MKKKNFIITIISILFIVQALAQKRVDIVYQLDHFACKGELTLKKKKAKLKISGNCDYLVSIKGNFTVTEENKIRVILKKKDSMIYGIKDFLIEDNCFIWDKKYQFCKKD